MFEQLSDRLTATFATLQGRPRVTDADLDAALRDVRVALLEADVNFKIVRELVATVRERAIGERVLESVTGAQMVVKIVHDALVEMLGGAAVPLAKADRPPTVIALVGLQGSGKTTTVAKLANLLRKQGRHPLLVAADLHRPAAVDQLQSLGKSLGVPVRTVDAERVAADVGDAKVNIAALAGSAMGSKGVIHVVVADKDAAKARRALKKAKLRVASDRKLLEIRLTDKPGTLARVATRLGKGRVSVDSAYMVGVGKGSRTIGFGVKDARKAKKALGR